jgi:glycosyltransferase involved in cell wall biosynthesis
VDLEPEAPPPASGARRSPLVSVIVPVYNAVHFVEEALESVSSQTFADFELIVVDDGSIDGSLAVLERHLAREPRMVLVRQPNAGGAAARNAAARRASGRYLAVMDADDVAEPDRFARQVAFLERHPDVDVLGASMRVITEDGVPAGYKTRPTSVDDVHGLLEHEITNPILDPTVMMRRDAFEAVGGYRSQFRTTYDYDLWLRMLPRRMCNLPDAVVRYRQHAEQTTRRGAVLTLYSLHVGKASQIARQRGTPDPAEDWDGSVDLDLLRRSTADPYVAASLYASLLRLLDDSPERHRDIDVVSRRQLFDLLDDVDVSQASVEGGDVFYILRAAASIVRAGRLASGTRLLSSVVRRYPRESYSAVRLALRHRLIG